MVSKSITKKKTNEAIKRELLNSLQENDATNNQVILNIILKLSR